MSKNTEALLVACKETGLEVNAEKGNMCACLSYRMDENSYHTERKQILGICNKYEMFGIVTS
jgi:hypothetical protein